MVLISDFVGEGGLPHKGPLKKVAHGYWFHQDATGFFNQIKYRFCIKCIPFFFSFKVIYLQLYK